MSAEKRSMSGSRRKQDVDALLADLSLDTPSSMSSRRTPSAGASPAQTQPSSGGRQPPKQDAQSMLDDLEELVQRRRTTPNMARASATPAVNRSATPLSESSAAPPARDAARAEPAAAADEPVATSAPQSSVSPTGLHSDGAEAPRAAWNQFSSFFSSASKLADQARHEIERRATAATQHLPAAEEKVEQTAGDDGKSLHGLSHRFTQRFMGLVHDSGLEKIGQDLGSVSMRGWHEIINAVAPPIEAHEVVKVTLSHGECGADGLRADCKTCTATTALRTSSPKC